MHSPLSSGAEVIARGMPESCLIRKNPYAANVYAKIKDIAGLNIETNVPYDLRLYKTGSSFVHGEEKGLDNCLIEIRDDEFDNLDAGVKKWMSILAGVII